MMNQWSWFWISVGFLMIFCSPIVGNQWIMLASGLSLVIFFGIKVFKKKK
jgi:hypothetical protein